MLIIYPLYVFFDLFGAAATARCMTILQMPRIHDSFCAAIASADPLGLPIVPKCRQLVELLTLKVYEPPRCLRPQRKATTTLRMAAD